MTTLTKRQHEVLNMINKWHAEVSDRCPSGLVDMRIVRALETKGIVKIESDEIHGLVITA